jgi:ribosome modulation factor
MATAEQIREALAAGRRGGAAGVDPTTCPYPAGVLRHFWLRAYVRAKLTRLGWPE